MILPAGDVMFVDEVLLAFDTLLVHRLQDLLTESDVIDEIVAPILCEILADHNPDHFHVVGMRRHVVSRQDPAFDAQLMSQRKFVVVAVRIGREAEGHERQAPAGFLGHDDETECFERVGEVVGHAGQVAHDGTVAVLSEANELIVLANDLAGPLAEVEGEGGLFGPEVIDIEDELLGEVLGAAPDDPANTRVHEAILKMDVRYGLWE
jgi:hypothetical protein